MLAVHEINSLGELEPLRPIWRRLLLETPNYSFFQSLEWLEAAWDHYPLPQKLRVMVVERDGETIGIVPFCVRTERRKLGNVRFLTYPLNDWGTFYGPISAAPSLTMQAALTHMARTNRDWDVVDLRYVDEAAVEFMAIGETLRKLEQDFVARPRMEVRLCRMEMGWEAYADSRSRNWRRQMRRDIEVLESRGEVCVVRHRPPAGGTGRDDRNLEIYRICEEVAAKSWQADDASQSTLSSPRVRDLLLELHCRAAALGMLDVNILTVAGRPVAYNYNYFAAGRTYGLRTGYDATVDLNHCGRILLYKTIEDSFHRGDVEHSFGPGRQQYKDRFATDTRYAYTFRHYAPQSLKSQALRWRERIASYLVPEEKLLEQGLVN